MKKLPAFLALLLCSLHALSQQATVKGTVIDTSEKKNLALSVVALLRPADSVLASFTRTDKDGHFTLQKLSPGSFILMVTRPAYADYFDTIRIKDAGTTDLGNISLILKSQLLQEVIVSHKLGAIRIKGDTTEYVADSFKVAAGATVEDLLKKLPGIQVDKDGKITAQGEAVQKVLVDGEEFFSDDPTIATRGLTSDAVDKVQVYDKKSDQATFTGIDDGQKTKTIDLKLKANRRHGYFGKIELGTDANKYWNNNGMFNAFKGKRQFAAFGIIGNTGKTGLDWGENEKYGVSGGPEIGVTDDGGMYYNGGASDEFSNGGGGFRGEGLPKGWAGGLHYSNKWMDDKMHLNAGYQYNKLNSEARGLSLNKYLLPDTILYVNENSNSFNSKERHKFNGLYEWQIDSSSSLKITVDGNKSTNYGITDFHSESFNNFGDTLSIVDRQVINNTESKGINSTLLWRQKFKKTGRTFSLSARQNYNENSDHGFLLSDNDFYRNGSIERQHIDQQKIRDNVSAVVNARAVYTEPLSKRSLLEFSYSIDNNHRKSRITTLEKKNAADLHYEDIVDSLSNQYGFDVFTQTGGISYRYSKPKRLSFSFGMNVSKAQYNRKDLLADTSANYDFTNFYPRANINWNLGSTGNLRLEYNGNTQAPSIDQIQPIRDNTDQLNIRIGNPNLKQAFRHNASLNYNSYKFLSERNLYTSIYFNTTQNDFSTINIIDLSTGKKIYQPVNVNGNYNLGSYAGYYKKIKKWNINTGFSLNGNISRNINYIDDRRNENNNITIGFGPNFSYYKEKKFDIYIWTRFSRNISKSSLRPELVTRYWTQDHYIGATVYLPWKIEIGSDVNFMFRQKIDAFDRNNNVVKWNARIDRKILKKDAARFRFSAFDILDQNIGFNRNTNSNFSSERTYDTLRRYFLLSFIWNFTKTATPEK